MREHTKLLFLGAGDWSGQELERLLKRVRYAFTIQGGLQQGPTQNTEEDKKEIMNIAKDLFVALTGYEVKAYTKTEY